MLGVKCQEVFIKAEFVPTPGGFTVECTHCGDVHTFDQQRVAEHKTCAPCSGEGESVFLQPMVPSAPRP